MTHWKLVQDAPVADPAVMGALLRRAISAKPDSAALHLKLAAWYQDQYDFQGAAAALQEALRLEPRVLSTRRKLARYYNLSGRALDALAVLASEEKAEVERGLALFGLGRTAEAEPELRAVLETQPQHRQACRQLCKLLRRAGRTADMLELCEALHRRGVSHAILLYNWGTALALAGQEEKARALLLDRQRVSRLELPVPDGFSSIAVFNAALAGELLGNPHRLTEFPEEVEANRGSSRVHALFAGRRPDLVWALLGSLQKLAQAWVPTRYQEFDPWIDARPAAAHLNAWGLIQRGSDYEEWHLHSGGWLSGVYYVRVPRSVSASGAGPGCIEFGPTRTVARELPELIPILRRAPREGTLLLAPSHYSHRTIPSGADEYRISFAFDVVPQTDAAATQNGTNVPAMSPEARP